MIPSSTTDSHSLLHPSLSPSRSFTPLLTHSSLLTSLMLFIFFFPFLCHLSVHFALFHLILFWRISISFHLYCLDLSYSFYRIKGFCTTRIQLLYIDRQKTQVRWCLSSLIFLFNITIACDFCQTLLSDPAVNGRADGQLISVRL